MGRFGEYVIDADGHGGEPLDWRSRIPRAFEPQMRAYVAEMRETYQGLPGGGMRHGDAASVRGDDDLDFSVPMRKGMYEPAADYTKAAL